MVTAKEKALYSYRDYLSWSEGERYELIAGAAYGMTPAPNRRHQKISLALVTQFYLFLEGKTCEVYEAPFDVKLSPDSSDDAPTVVQPDIVVCCDPAKLTEQGISGAPDLIIEIASPSSGIMDRKIKFALYEQYGVGEYWLVEPDEKVVEVFLRDDQGRYSKRIVYGAHDSIAVDTLDGLTVELARIF